MRLHVSVSPQLSTATVSHRDVYALMQHADFQPKVPTDAAGVIGSWKGIPVTVIQPRKRG